MKNALNLTSMVTRTDSYKFSQFAQYPKGTTHISSYIESRGGEDESVFFGLQAFIKEYLMTPITMNDVKRAEHIVQAHGLPFNREGWEIIVNEYGGRLPIEIQAVPEGTDHENQVIRTYTDTLINYVGQLIEDRELKPEQVKVITEFGIHRFDASGVLDSSWPYGIFNWDK
jgi:nicotinic acid phosphoribosyltransferase